MVLVISVMVLPMSVLADSGTVYLVCKDLAWSRINESTYGTFNYITSGPTLNFSFNAVGLGATTKNYSLIYFADPYPGTTSCRLLGLGTSLVDGTLVIAGSPDLGMDLPTAPDSNMLVEYNVFPNSLSAKPHGAKIWLVPASDFSSTVVGTAGVLTAWNPTEILFETDLVLYTDTNKLPTTTGTPLVTIVTTPIASIGLEVSPPSGMNFGSVEIGQCSTAGSDRLVTLRNTGTVPIKVTSIPSVGFYTTSLYLGSSYATATTLANVWSVNIPVATSVNVYAKVCPQVGLTGSVTGSIAFIASFAP